VFAELLAGAGRRMIREFPPEGRRYWAARFWDREEVESRPVLGDDFRAQKQEIARYIKQYGGAADRVLEIACGTGEFTEMAATLTSATEIVATDISPQAARMTRQRVDHPNLRTEVSDFWNTEQERAPLVLCVDAIHHLGEVPAVLSRLRTFVQPGGTFIGNLWTIDNFHEYQRGRYGSVQHLLRSALFFCNALVMRLSNGRLRWASYRTQLLSSQEIEPLLHQIFSDVLEIKKTRYFIAFACRA
jgi:ubiquinone/menaquinone biosynthesis C-methylase UbiE